jgi:16S rRNA (guanine(527)-N(7))-methyltransferase RsmG
MTPGLAALKQILNECGVGLSGAKAELLWRYHQLLREADAELNLTRIRNFENMVIKHYVDSLLVLKFEELPSPLLDVGTGPGLPGIPLKIARPDVRVILAETRAARADFLRRACEILGLEGAEVHSGKISSRFDRRVRGVITRAVAAIPETLEDVSGCLERGGRVLFMKGPECDDEIGEARSILASSYRLAADHPYSIPGTSHRRRLVVYERLEAPVQLEAGVRKRAFAGSAREIVSSSNPLFKEARELLTGKGVRKRGKALIAGQRIIQEVLEQFPDRAEAWLTDSKAEPPPDGVPSGLVWYRLSGELFRELDVSGTKSPLLLIQTPEIPAWSDSEAWPSGCTLFVPFQDPENVGAVIRSAAAFGVARVVLLREAANPFHPKAVRAAGPAVLQVPILAGPSITELSTQSVSLIGLDSAGLPLGQDPWPDRFGLVPGLEGPGLPERLRSAPENRCIPINEGVESLNAATAVAIALYDWRRFTQSS